tara:strand:- start:13452 stop:15593 length:2142 start_codon:yes stop_codon:yes gene_type:complete
VDFNNIQNKKHREIIQKLCNENKGKSSLFLNDYEKYKNYKSLMKNENLNFEDFFEEEVNFKAFERFSDSMSNAIIKNEAKKLKKHIITSKYKHLDSEKLDELFLSLAENDISKEVLRENLGKKMVSFSRKSKEEFYDTVKEIVEGLISWDYDKYLKNKINEEDIINIDPDNKLILLDMGDIDKVEKYGSNMWCIKRDEEYYKEYRSEGYRFYNLYDFNKPAGSKESQVAIVSDFDGKIVDAYFKNDDRGLDYALEHFDDYRFSKMNIEEIVDYLNVYDSFKNQDFLIKFIKINNEFLDDEEEFYISYDESPDYDESIDRLMELGYPVRNLQMYSDKDFLNIMKFIHTEDWESEEIAESFSKHNENDQAEFYAYCLYKKLTIDRGESLDKVLDVAEKIMNKTGLGQEIFFNDSFFNLNPQYQNMIFDNVENLGLNTSFFVLNNTPLENSKEAFNYIKKDSEYESNIPKLLKKIDLNSSYLEITNSRVLALASNTELLDYFNDNLIKKSYLLSSSYFNKDRNESNHVSLFNIINERKEDFKDFFISKINEVQNKLDNSTYKNTMFLNNFRQFSFDTLYGLKKMYPEENIFNDFIENRLKNKDLSFKNSNYYNEVLKNENDDFKIEFLRTALSYDYSNYTSEAEMTIFKKKELDVLLKESTSFLQKLNKKIIIDKEEVETGFSYASKKDLWKYDHFIKEVEKELKQRSVLKKKATI